MLTSSDECLSSPGAVTTSSSASTSSNPISSSSAACTSSGIMRGEQTVKLIQLYHQHHPDIGRNTQDGEGRKIRNVLWAKITEELNAAFTTSFSQEQFKKKVQNVQCTSRQKMQAGKRNLGDAELEYVRLFEPEKLGGGDLMGSPSSSIQLDDSDQREMEEKSVAATATIDHDHCVSNFKLEHFLEVLAGTAAANGSGAMGVDGGAKPLDATQQLAEILAVIANGTATGSAAIMTSPLGSQQIAQNSNSRKKRRGALASAGLLAFDHGHVNSPSVHSPPTKPKKRKSTGGAINNDHRDGSAMEGEWGRKMLEMHRNIVSAQRQIFRLLEQQKTRNAGRVPTASCVSPPSPPSTVGTTATVSPLSALDYASNAVTAKAEADESTSTLNSKLDALTSALLRIDATLRERLPPPHRDSSPDQP